MEILFSFLALAGMGVAAVWGLKWMVRNGQPSKRDEQLTPNDLKVLEESAARLISDINAAADECVARVEQALAQVENRIRSIEAVRCQPSAAYPAHSGPTSIIDIRTPTTPASNGYEMIDSDEAPAQIARQSGMTTGEVELLRGLRKMSSK